MHQVFTVGLHIDYTVGKAETHGNTAAGAQPLSSSLKHTDHLQHLFIQTMTSLL